MNCTKFLFTTIVSLTVTAAQATQPPYVLSDSIVCWSSAWLEDKITKLEAEVKAIDVILANKIMDDPSKSALVTQGAIALIILSVMASAGVGVINHFAETKNPLYLGIMAALPIALLNTLVCRAPGINTVTPDQFIKALKLEKREIEKAIEIYKQALAYEAMLVNCRSA